MQTNDLIDAILRRYELRWCDIHGLAHWGRVLENGLQLAAATGANRDVVTLFAFFHDACRVNEGLDSGHGKRGAELAASLSGVLFDLNPAECGLLYVACARHTDGLTEGDITVQVCWDADRLDLRRAGIQPLPELLCTDAARDPELMAWADERAENHVVPATVRPIWERLLENDPEA